LSTKGVPRRNRTKAEREAAKNEIQYDLTQDQETGRSRARGRGAREQQPQPPKLNWPIRADSPISLGPSGLPMLRTSERTTFKRCRWLWTLEFVDLRKPHYDTPALMFGSMIHQALAGYYKKGIRRGPSPVDLFHKAVLDETIRVSNLTGQQPHVLGDEWADRIELGVAMLTNYLETYGKDEEWKVLATETPFQVIVAHPRDGVTPWFWYTGILDLLIENRSTGKKLIVDHKTASAIQLRYLALDEQTTSYWTWGVEALRRRGMIGQKEIIDGLLFNFLRKAMPDERPFRIENGHKYYLNNPTKANPEGEISKKQPTPYFHRETVWRHNLQKERSRERAIGEMLDMQAVRREPNDRAAYKNNSKFTCAGCWAIDICELHEMGGDYEALIAASTRAWDPYEQHELYFSEAR
jgi:hypothetical protein